MRRRLALLVLLSLSLGSVAAPALAGDDPLDQLVEARFEGDVSIGRAYELIGDLVGIRFVFEEGVRPGERFSLDVAGLTTRQALAVLDEVSGLWRRPVVEGVQLVIPENQTQRRIHEVQAVRTFYIQHADVMAVSAMLRGIIDIRKTAVDERTGSMTIRDTEAKLALAAELISHLDLEHPPVGIMVELWLLNPKRAKELRERQDASGLLSAKRVDQLRRSPGVEVLVSQLVSTTDEGAMQFQLGENKRINLELEATTRLHLDAREMTLEVSAQVSMAPDPTGSSSAGGRNLRSTARLREAESLVLAGLALVDPESRRPRSILDDTAAEALEMAVLLSPRVGTWPVIPEEYRAALQIGTERRIGLPSH